MLTLNLQIFEGCCDTHISRKYSQVVRNVDKQY